MKNVGLFVDVSNVYYCMIKKYGKGQKLNYSALLAYVRALGNLNVCVAYESVMPGRSGLAKNFTKHLASLGFTVRTKRVKTFKESDTLISHKADWDVGIAVDMIKHLDHYDIAVLSCADGDMRELVEYLVAHGKQVIVLACGISSDLKESATRCVEIPGSMVYQPEAKHETAETT